MNREKICNVRGVFTGIYAWGEGWSKETAEKWDDFLRNYKGIFWRAIEPKSSMSSWYLVSTHGSVYLHPMDFDTVLKSSGGCSPRGNDDMLEDYFGSELEELKELCTKLAEHCGGSFTSMVAEAQIIENNNLRQLITKEDNE